MKQLTFLLMGSLFALSARAEVEKVAQRAMDVYDCYGLVRADKKYPDIIKKDINDFVINSIAELVKTSPQVKNYEIKPFGATYGEPEKVAEKASQRVYALASVARNLNCPVLYIPDDITTYLFTDLKCATMVMNTLKSVYSYEAKYVGNNSTCADGRDHFVVDLFSDLEVL